jgi:hypothetical protein
MIESKTPRAERTGAGVYAPVIALAAGVLAVLALVVTVMVNQFDDVALTMQVQTAERGYRNRLTSFAAMVQPGWNPKMPSATLSRSLIRIGWNKASLAISTTATTFHACW